MKNWEKVEKFWANASPVKQVVTVTSIVIGICVLLNILVHALSGGDVQKTDDAARIAPYKAALKMLQDGIDGGAAKVSDLEQNLTLLSDGLRNKQITSGELGMANYNDPVFRNQWLAEYRVRVRVMRGTQKLNALVELANSDKKRREADIRKAQMLGMEILALNKQLRNEFSDHQFYVDACVADIAECIKRVKNPKLPKVEISGYWAGFSTD